MPNTAEPGPGTQLGGVPAVRTDRPPHDPGMRSRPIGPSGTRSARRSEDDLSPTPRPPRPPSPKGSWPLAWARAPGWGCWPPTAPTGSPLGWPSAASELSACWLNTYYKSRELDWVLRHADVQVLLSAVPQFLGHDYLARLEEVVSPGQDPVIAEPHRTPTCARCGSGSQCPSYPWASSIGRSAGRRRRRSATNCSPPPRPR